MAPISAFDFDIIKSVMVSFAATMTRDPVTLRELARLVVRDYHPDEASTDEVLDALVVSALRTMNVSGSNQT